MYKVFDLTGKTSERTVFFSDIIKPSEKQKQQFKDCLSKAILCALERSCVEIVFEYGGDARLSPEERKPLGIGRVHKRGNRNQFKGVITNPELAQQ